MFGRLQRPKKVDVNCPYCGHSQQEPSLVISSFCRSCGEHFRVRKGIAIANPGLKVSGIAEIRTGRLPKRLASLLKPEPENESAIGDSWLVSADEKESGAHALTRPEPEIRLESQGISAGAFFGLSTEEDEPNFGDAEDSEPGIGEKAQSKEALAQGSLAAMIESGGPALGAEIEKMPPNYVAPDQRRKRDEPVPERDVRCYRCYHIQAVSRFAKSTQCERCSAYISLANYEISAIKSHTLRTRGDVSISRKGGLVNGSEIACHHLTVTGAIDAFVDCSGSAVFRHSGEVRGNLFCERLVVEKNCEVRFPDGVMTGRAEISGHLIGDLICSGNVKIGRTGIVEGDVTAINLETKEGGRISGKTKIDPETKTDLPLKKGFNPTVIG
ncbi:MAG TPA: polymer-forming cytoskeletal protein [Verrucomicrobiales bacterium]|nr:polymer-forming cytoskeletal protein [Verrucomicrobiales bacterium]